LRPLGAEVRPGGRAVSSAGSKARLTRPPRDPARAAGPTPWLHSPSSGGFGLTRAARRCARAWRRGSPSPRPSAPRRRAGPQPAYNAEGVTRVRATPPSRPRRNDPSVDPSCPSSASGVHGTRLQLALAQLRFSGRLLCGGGLGRSSRVRSRLLLGCHCLLPSVPGIWVSGGAQKKPSETHRSRDRCNCSRHIGTIQQSVA